MIISPAVGRCWMALLLVVAQALLSQSNPLPSKRKLCGSTLSSALNDVCKVYKGYFQVTQTEVRNGLTTQKESKNGPSPTTGGCCQFGCTQEDLESFCAEVRSQTTTELPNVSVSTNVKDLISQPLESLTTTETPSDSTPEIFYNESFEQDALTILPTYRTPQYNNLQYL